MSEQESETNGAERRDFFRIQYPLTGRPFVCVGNHEFPVIDISEKGLKFALEHEKELVFGDSIKVRLIQDNQEIARMEGRLAVTAEGRVRFCPGDSDLGQFNHEVQSWFKLESHEELFPVSLADTCIRLMEAEASFLAHLPTIEATVRFDDGEEILVSGQVLRVRHKEAVLFLSFGVPFSKIVSEQRNLIKKYARYEDY